MHTHIRAYMHCHGHGRICTKKNNHTGTCTYTHTCVNIMHINILPYIHTNVHTCMNTDTAISGYFKNLSLLSMCANKICCNSFCRSCSPIFRCTMHEFVYILTYKSEPCVLCFQLLYRTYVERVYIFFKRYTF